MQTLLTIFLSFSVSVSMTSCASRDSVFCKKNLLTHYVGANLEK